MPFKLPMDLGCPTGCAPSVLADAVMPAFTMITTPTALQRWAVELLGVSRRHGLA